MEIKEMAFIAWAVLLTGGVVLRIARFSLEYKMKHM